MAFQTSSTTGWATGNLVITKPSGLAVGDLMVAQVGFNGTAPTTPSGWTMARNISSGASQERFYWIIATSTEVAASDFTWADNTAGAEKMAGGIARIDGQIATSPVGSSPGEGQTSTSTNVTFTTISVTPSVLESMLLYFVSISKNGSATLNCSNQAIATSNPTWTEAWDLTDNATGKGISFAYATRPEVTATGNASATSSAAPDDYCGIMCAIAMKVVRTLTDTITMSDSITKKPTIVLSETITMTDDLDSNKIRSYSNQSKNSSTWTNENK